MIQLMRTKILERIKKYLSKWNSINAAEYNKYKRFHIKYLQYNKNNEN